MKNTMRLRLFLLAVLLLPTVAVAGKKQFEWDPITDTDWSIKRDTAKSYTDAVMIFERIVENDKKYEVDKCYRTIYRRIRVLSDDGREWGDVEVPFLDEDQKILDIQGRAVLRDGTISLLNEEHIFEKQAIKAKKLKRRQTTFSVPGVTDDCIVEYVIKYRTPDYNIVWIAQKDIPLLRGELRWVLTEWDLSASQAELYEEVITPNYLWLNTYSRVNVEQLPNIKEPETLLFVTDNIPAFESEPYTVPEAALKTKLLCYYGSNEHPEAYWDGRSNKQEKAFEKYCKKNKRVRKIVERFSNLQSNDEKIAAAAQWIQDSILNLSYFDYRDPKDPTKTKKPKDRKSVDDVIKRGYGNRYEISYLFCDMLREMNIDAKVVFAQSRFDNLFVKQAKYWQFDRALVALTDESGKSRFYSPGFPYMQYEEVPYFLEGATALICGGYEYLSPIPFSDASNTSISRVYAYTIDEELSISGTVSEKSSGAQAQSLRLTILDEDTVDINDLLTEDIADEFSGGEIELVSYDNFDDIGKPVVLKYNIEHPEITQTGSKVLLRPVQYLSYSKSPFGTDERKEAIMFGYGYHLRETAQIAIPEEWKIEALPSDTSFKNQIGECAVSFQAMGDKLTVQRMFNLDFPFWRVEFIDQIRDLFMARQNFAESIVVLNETEE